MANKKKEDVQEEVSVPEEVKPNLADKDGHAVMSVEVPARTVEVSLAYSSIEGCAVAAVEAWNKVRNVAGGDVSFADALPQFRQELINAAEAIYKGGQPTLGDTTMAKFEREVAIIRGKQEKAKAQAAKAVA